jgi:hypothetical protein
MLLAFLLIFISESAAQFYSDIDLLPYSFNTSGAFYGCGISAHDVDNNGWDDLTFGGKFAPLRLFLNFDGVLSEFDLGLFYNEEVKAVLWADYDNDGDADLFVSLLYAPCRLYRNEGNLQLTDVTVEAGLPLESVENWGASWADVNSDGFLDLYLCKYVNPNNGTGYAKLNHLYINNGDGTFNDVSNSSVTNDGYRFSFQSVFFDYDRDGDPDLYVINDKTDRNALYKNQGNGQFTDQSIGSGAAIVIDAMSATGDDYDDDGYPDLYITNNPPGNVLLHNSQNGTFLNHSYLYNLQVFKSCWAAQWLDANNDGNVDLYVATQGTAEGEQNYFYLQEDDSFIQNPEAWLLNDTANTYASVNCDLNNDGYVDIVNSNDAPFNSQVWLNSGGDNHFIAVDLEGVLSNRDAIGSSIEIYYDGNYRYRYTTCGENYLGQNSSKEIFGLAQHTLVDSIKITWPGGLQECYYNLPADSCYHFLEGHTLHLSLNNGLSINLCQGDSLTFCLEDNLMLTWNNGSNDHCLNLFTDSLLWCSIQHPLGFIYQSDTLEVNTYSTPEINLNIQNVSCFGNNNAEVNFTSINDINLINVYSTTLEHNGLTWNELYAGNYQAIYQDENLCVDTLYFNISQPEILEFIIYCSSQLTENDASITYDLSGGTAPYELYWNDGSTINSLDNLGEGQYILWAYDSNGCFASDSCSVERITSIENNTRENILQLFPNPVFDYIHLQGTVAISSILITDLTGKVVMSKIDHAIDQPICVASISPGMYILHRAGHQIPFVKE